MRTSSMCDRGLWRAIPAFAAFVALALQSSVVQAQCTFDWQAGEGAPGVVGSGTVFASTSWDPDGPGPSAPLAVFGGSFLAAGNVATRCVGAWDGAEWHTYGEGLNYQVRDLLVYNGDLVAAA